MLLAAPQLMKSGVHGIRKEGRRRRPRRSVCQAEFNAELTLARRVLSRRGDVAQASLNVTGWECYMLAFSTKLLSIYWLLGTYFFTQPTF